MNTISQLRFTLNALCWFLVILPCAIACSGGEPESVSPDLELEIDGRMGTEAENEGILDEILGEGERLRESKSDLFAGRVLRALYRDGDLKTVLDAMAWRNNQCRIGTYQCDALESLPRRVGALVALVPSKSLRPVGMKAKEFEEEIEATLARLEPAPDKALPYIPKEKEALFRYKDHHGLARYLLLERAGSTWRVVALARADQFGGVASGR